MDRFKKNRWTYNYAKKLNFKTKIFVFQFEYVNILCFVNEKLSMT